MFRLPRLGEKRRLGLMRGIGGISFGANSQARIDAILGSVGWDHQEPNGAVLGAYNSALALGRDIALNTYGDYTAGANWSNPSGELARHAAGSTATLQQDDILAAGRTYQATVVMSNRTAGSVTITEGGAAIDANGATVRTITSTGADFIITPTSDFDGDIDVAITLVQQTNIPANDSNLNGTHTGSTVGQPATPALGLAVLDDGATSYTDIHSIEINSMFDPASFTLLLFGKAIDVGVWTDGSVRNLIKLQASSQNRMQIFKNLTPDNINVRYEANNIDKSIDIDTGAPVDYFMIALTIDTGADEGKVYFNGVQVGADLTSLGTWVGNLESDKVVIGAISTAPLQVWDGFRTRVELLRGVLDDAAILQIAEDGGVA